MTQLDVVYRYGAAPSERSLLALSKVRDVYGVRLVEVREAEKTVRVEYDASRLTGAAIQKMLRRAGLDIVETVEGSARAEEIAGAGL
jgi:citrate lyase beta subunit